MALFFITGSPGTGKSEICRQLNARGIEAYDADSKGFAQWKNVVTGYIHPKSSVSAEDRTPDFMKVHVWQVPRSAVEELKVKATNHLIFLCGDIGNEDELPDLFDGIIALRIDEETLKHRLSARTGNDWGRQPHELKRTLDYHKTAYDKYRKMGATIVDSTQPIEAVVDEVLSIVDGSNTPA